MIQAYDRDAYSEEIDNTDITDYTAHFTREDIYQRHLSHFNL